MTKNNNQNIFGWDPGMGNQKLFSVEGGTIFPSHIAVKNGSTVATSGGIKAKNKPMELNIDGSEFYAGLSSHWYGEPIENLGYDRLLGAPELRVMFYAVMTKHILEHKLGNHLSISKMVVGLPFELCGDDFDKNKRKVSKFLKGIHVWQADGLSYEITIDNVDITNQAIGAFFDMQLDQTCKFISENVRFNRGGILVVSVGNKTTEILFLDDMKLVPNKTAGKTYGVSDLLRMTDPEGLYTLAQLDEKLRDKVLDISQTEPLWTRNVLGNIQQVGGDWKQAQRVILVGGGAALINGTFNNYFAGRAYRPDDPILSVVRGLYKMGVMRSKSKSKK